MSGNVPSPAERLQAAADRIREVAGKATPGPWRAQPYLYRSAGGGWAEPSDAEVYAPGIRSNAERCVVSHQPHEGGGADVTDAEFIAFFDPVVAELVAVLLEGMAAHWATRPIADWNDYAITPLAALERHINGEETTA